jgi:hypothetical protein
MCFFVLNGFTQKKPFFLTVPWYLPNKTKTEESFGLIISKPGKIKTETIMPTRPKTINNKGLETVSMLAKAKIEALRISTKTNNIKYPERGFAFFSIHL